MPDLPLAADVRARSIRASLRRLEDEYLRIAARLLAVGFDDLRQRAVRLRLQRQRRIIGALAVVIVFVLGARLRLYGSGKWPSCNGVQSRIGSSGRHCILTTR